MGIIEGSGSKRCIKKTCGEGRDNDTCSSSLSCSHLQHLCSGTRESLAVLTTVYACVVPVCVKPAWQEPDIAILSCHVEAVSLTKNFPRFVGIKVTNDNLVGLQFF